jgi:excisionase family DNA binding protein
LADGHNPLRLLGLREVAEVLGTDWRNVRGLVERGELPAVHVGATREPRISLAMLEAWQRRLATSSTAPQPGAAPTTRVAALPVVRARPKRAQRSGS